VATEARKVQVGIFVLVALVLGTITLIWIGASRFFEDTRTMVTYFAESVQGLDPGSSVKYRGVPCGRVERVAIAADGELIEVDMSIDREIIQALKRDPSLRATLELSGITGLRYIEIDRRTGDALNESPALSFKPRYDLILSTRSSFRTMQTALGDVYDKFMAVDIAGVSSDARSTLQAVKALLTDPRLDALLTHFEGTARATEQVANNLENMTAGVQLGPAVQQVMGATAEARRLLANFRESNVTAQLSTTLEHVNRLALSTQQAVVTMQAAVERLDRSLGTLQSLGEDVRSQPSLLLFSAPPEPRRPSERGAQ
jgi:ABC-type transporter Mla subunit MlaD